MSIKRILTVSSVISSALIITIAVFAYLGLGRVENTMLQIVGSSVALSNHQHADMMHDALRGDVYRALLASHNGAAAQDAARKAAHEHANAFRKKVA